MGRLACLPAHPRAHQFVPPRDVRPTHRRRSLCPSRTARPLPPLTSSPPKPAPLLPLPTPHSPPTACVCALFCAVRATPLVFLPAFPPSSYLPARAPAAAGGSGRGCAARSPAAPTSHPSQLAHARTSPHASSVLFATLRSPMHPIRAPSTCLKPRPTQTHPPTPASPAVVPPPHSTRLPSFPLLKRFRHQTQRLPPQECTDPIPFATPLVVYHTSPPTHPHAVKHPLQPGSAGLGSNSSSAGA